MEEFTGYVFFILLNEGSKSEHYGPVLLKGMKAVMLYKNGDNPLTHESVKPFHAKYCKVTGVYDADINGIEAELIEEIDDPAISYWNEPDENNFDEKDLKEDSHE